MPGSTVGPVPIIRMYGVTEIGNSVQMNVHGFTPYFYVIAPKDFKQSDCSYFRSSLNVPFSPHHKLIPRNKWN